MATPPVRFCLTGFARDAVSSGRTVTLEHVPIKALGGQPRCLTCRNCNAETGRGIDQAAAMAGRDRFGVTVNILGKRDTFMLSPDGKALTPPFAGYSKQDLKNLASTKSRTFTMSMKIPDVKGRRGVCVEVGVSRHILATRTARRVRLRPG